MKEHIIKNYAALATNPLRKDALDILEAGYEAILTKNVIRGAVTREENTICIKDMNVCFDDYERIFFVGVGKCAVDAATALEEIIGDKLTEGVVLDVKSGIFKKLTSRVGTHPYPTEQNVEAAKEIAAMLEKTTEKDLVLTVISGGGSSLLCLPHELKCESITKITKGLMDKGAPIHEINTVRKHLSEIQGGWLAQMAYPAKVISLLFSDVPGNDIGTIASGPTVLDTSTKVDAEEILMKYDAFNLCEVPYCEILETPKDEKYFKNVHNILVVTNDTALEAMAKKATELEYGAVICSNCAQGEARDFGKKIASDEYAVKGCFLYGGETTVTVSNDAGTGGRNQEVVLGAFPYVREGMLIVGAASDGWDNSDVAGAMADKEFFDGAEEMKLYSQDFLEKNDSYEFFKRAGGHIQTGRTGANVADFYFVLVS
jgi:glycerate-2-kinase